MAADLEAEVPAIDKSLLECSAEEVAAVRLARSGAVGAVTWGGGARRGRGARGGGPLSFESEASRGGRGQTGDSGCSPSPPPSLRGGLRCDLLRLPRGLLRPGPSAAGT